MAATDDLYSGLNFDLDTRPPTGAAGAGKGLTGLGALPQGLPSGAPGTLGALRGVGGAAGFGARTGTGARGMTGMGTAAGGADGPRPMTSVKAAGYQSKPGSASRTFDPTGGMPAGPAPPLEEKEDSSPEAKASEMEKRVNRVLEASAEAAASGDAIMALERAKEAGKRERALVRHRDSNGLSDDNNTDLTFAVFFALANAYALNGMHSQALDTYDIIYRNKDYQSPGRVKINVANIHFAKGDFAEALKHSKMALDQIPPTNKHLRLRVERNVGVTLIRLGRFQEAIERLEAVTDQYDEASQPDFAAAFNLVVCYYALGDRELMRRGFQRLLALPMPAAGEGDEDDDDDDDEAEPRGEPDALGEYLRAKHAEAAKLVTTAARLIAPVVDPRSWESGYAWVVDQLRHDHPQIASELLVVKALAHLNRRQFDRAIEQLKAFERKEKHHKARAATNLAFLYLLEGDVAQATRYASLAVKHDRYNAKALVNMGNCLCESGELEHAKELFLEAIGVEADCVEAIFDLGLVNKQLGVYQEAIQAFEKLHTLVPSSPEVLYHLGNLHDAMGNQDRAVKYFNYLVSRVKSDPGVLARLGHLFNTGDDDAEAFRFHQDSYSFYPVNLDVISFLGIWYVKAELYEKAVEYFRRAAEVEPKEAKWQLMVASCYRRMREFDEAVARYEAIHEAFPDNIECLTYLVAICRDLHRPCDAYEERLMRLEREQAAKAPDAAGYDDGPEASPERGGGGGGGFDRQSSPRFGGDADAFVPSFDSPGGGGGAPSPGGIVVRSARAGAAASASASSSAEARFAAPAQQGGAVTRGGGAAIGHDDDDDDFADADLDSMLTE